MISLFFSRATVARTNYDKSDHHYHRESSVKTPNEKVLSKHAEVMSLIKAMKEKNEKEIREREEKEKEAKRFLPHAHIKGQSNVQHICSLFSQSI